MRYSPNQVPDQTDWNLNAFVGNELARLAQAFRNVESDTLTASLGGSRFAPQVIVSDSKTVVPTLFGGSPPLLAIETTSNVPLSLSSYIPNGQAPALGFRHSRSGTIGAHTAVIAGDFLGQVLFYGSDGTDFSVSAGIIPSVVGAVSSGIIPGRIAFFTTTAAGAFREVSAFEPDGRLNLTPSGGGLVKLGASTPGGGLDVSLDLSANGSGSFAFIGFHNANFAARRGYIGHDQLSFQIQNEINSSPTFFTIKDSGGTLRTPLAVSSVGAATAIGFQGTSAIAKPTVTGSRGANAALASVLTALANYGLIIDSSS